MNAWVLLLDAIGKVESGRLPASALRRLLKGFGLRQVKTFPKSNDAIFCGVIDARAFGSFVEDMIAANHGWRPRALVLSRERFAEIIAARPAAGTTRNSAEAHIWFLHRSSPARSEALRKLAAPGDRLALTEDALYHHAPGGIDRARLAARLEAVLGVRTTLRAPAEVNRIDETLATLRDD
ncbi:DUF1697 domain-containing protein [Sinisalibacter lacisalsi]|uniref:Uncharacterized protein n=1 Tax=Sinisalibacter lacisalsi TaxID=1526570 RepID=A0ABQ1QMC8_9RHOB|nr:DUF1697 domain-containing protein [Sinisalibacter lacisalsi]GGD33623.1 hypothetical protein GCM10011358_17100 [Sinisalibacter lacisalsi]